MGPLVPTGTSIDRETLLDITVNIIPIGILLFFVVVFAVFDPFPTNLFMVGLSELLTIVPLVLLTLLTYVAAKVIARDERKLEERSAESQSLAPRSTAGEDEVPATDEATESTDDSGKDDRIPEDESHDEHS